MQDESLPFPSCRPKSLVLQDSQSRLPSRKLGDQPPSHSHLHPQGAQSAAGGNMATNGVYFGAEIVRDLTPAPGSRMAKRREGGVGEGWEREPTSQAPTLLLPLPTSLSVLLCPSVSLPPSSSGCQLSPSPHVCLLLSGQGSRPLVFGTQVPLPEGGSKDPWTDQEDSQGTGRGQRGWHWQGAKEEL